MSIHSGKMCALWVPEKWNKYYDRVVYTKSSSSRCFPSILFMTSLSKGPESVFETLSDYKLGNQEEDIAGVNEDTCEWMGRDEKCPKKRLLKTHEPLHMLRGRCRTLGGVMDWIKINDYWEKHDPMIIKRNWTWIGHLFLFLFWIPIKRSKYSRMFHYNNILIFSENYITQESIQCNNIPPTHRFV